MKPRYSPHYLDQLFSSDTYEDLVQVSSLLSGMDRFSLGESDYGLPEPLFVFVETLAWFAQSWRSGAWTYYEATPLTRQAAMSRALERLADPELAHCYTVGMQSWQNPEAMLRIDDWIESHDDDVMGWIRSLVRANRTSIKELLT